MCRMSVAKVGKVEGEFGPTFMVSSSSPDLHLFTISSGISAAVDCNPEYGICANMFISSDSSPVHFLSHCSYRTEFSFPER